MFEYLNLKLIENDYSITELRAELDRGRWGKRYHEVMSIVESLSFSVVDGFYFFSVSISRINHTVFSKDIDTIVEFIRLKFRKDMLIEIRTENAIKNFSFNSIGKRAESPWIYLDKETNEPDENAHRIVAFIDNLKQYYSDNLGKNKISADYVYDRVRLSLMSYKYLSQNNADRCCKRVMSHEFSSEWAGEYVVLIDYDHIELESLYHLYRKVVEDDISNIFFNEKKMSSKAFFGAIADYLR